MLNVVLMLVVFVFFVFSVIGVQLFQGSLRQRCFSMTTGLMLRNTKVCIIIPPGDGDEPACCHRAMGRQLRD